MMRGDDGALTHQLALGLSGMSTRTTGATYWIWSHFANLSNINNPDTDFHVIYSS
jgi:hypothetical protein